MSRILTKYVLKNLIRSRFNPQSNCTRFYSKCEGLIIEPRNQVLWLRFNRPEKYNAITKEMYVCITETFNQANSDESIKAIVLTGNGEYYSSGNDLSNLTLAMQHPKGPQAGLSGSSELLYNFVSSFINLDKLLISAVNGPAVGIPVTTLPLFDYVIASDKASFQSPFTAIGQCPEACSSMTFPQIMGPSRANELLLLNMKWNAEKAERFGLVSKVIEHNKFYSYLEDFLYGEKGLVSSCYPISLRVSKSLIKSPQTKQKLLEVNRRECDAILGLWLGEECANALRKFFQKPKK